MNLPNVKDYDFSNIDEKLYQKFKKIIDRLAQRN